MYVSYFLSIYELINIWVFDLWKLKNLILFTEDDMPVYFSLGIVGEKNLYYVYILNESF